MLPHHLPIHNVPQHTPEGHLRPHPWGDHGPMALPLPMRPWALAKGACRQEATGSAPVGASAEAWRSRSPCRAPAFFPAAGAPLSALPSRLPSAHRALPGELEGADGAAVARAVVHP